jgi:hypothetical protein
MPVVKPQNDVHVEILLLYLYSDDYRFIRYIGHSFFNLMISKYSDGIIFPLYTVQ